MHQSLSFILENLMDFAVLRFMEIAMRIVIYLRVSAGKSLSQPGACDSAVS